MNPSIPQSEWEAFYKPHLSIFKIHGTEASARCPFPDHADQNPSFAVNLTNGVYYCHGCGESGNGITFAKAFDISMEEVPTYEHANNGTQPKILATYTYVDQSGKLLYEVIRKEPKGFFQRRPDGNGVAYNLEGIKRVPYKLPDVISAVAQNKQILIVEGEKDADNAISLGFYATTNSGGAGRWEQRYSDYLIGATVIIVPDKDEVGRAHADQVARSLHGKATSIKVLILPGEGKDISDWIAAGGTAQQLQTLIDAQLLWQPAVPEETDELKILIKSIATDKFTAMFEKKRAVASLVIKRLSETGTFYRSDDERLFYFSNMDRKLYPLDDEAFGYLMTAVSGLNPTEEYFKFIWNELEASTSRTAPTAQINTIASCNLAQGIITVSDGGSGVWIYDGKSWTSGNNGQNNAIFITEPGAQTWKPDFSAKGKALDWFLERFNFSGSAEERSIQKQTLEVFIISTFFRSMTETKPIPAFLGPRGSGKTATSKQVGRLFLGAGFNVCGPRGDKEDSFVAGITSRTWYVIDNADSKIKWLEDALARYATGESHRMRQLFTTNQEVSYLARAVLMLTSRDPHFRRPDVAERILPFRLDRIEEFQDESSFLQELYAKREMILGDLLKRVEVAMKALQSIPPKRTRIRMADFGSFGMRLYTYEGKEAEWERILDYLDKAQSQFASEEDILIEMIREVVNEGLVGEFTTGDLFKKCQIIARRENWPISRTSQGFGRQFWERKGLIENELGVKIFDRALGGGSVGITFQKPLKGGASDGSDTNLSHPASPSSLPDVEQSDKKEDGPTTSDTRI